VSEQATDYMEGALSLRRRLAMRWHLRQCSMCRAYLDQLRKTIALLAAGDLPPPAPETERELLAAVPPPDRP
jgi:anti-sigma factor RsiW